MRSSGLARRLNPIRAVINCFEPDSGCDILLAELPPLPPGPVEVRVTGQPRSDVDEIENMSLDVRAATWF